MTFTITIFFKEIKVGCCGVPSDNTSYEIEYDENFFEFLKEEIRELKNNEDNIKMVVSKEKESYFELSLKNGEWVEKNNKFTEELNYE